MLCTTRFSGATQYYPALSPLIILSKKHWREQRFWKFNQRRKIARTRHPQYFYRYSSTKETSQLSSKKRQPNNFSSVANASVVERELVFSRILILWNIAN